MRPLTVRASACLSMIEDWLATVGYAPSCDEIKMALDLPNRGVAARTLNQLETRGYIRRVKRKARAVELLNHTRTICPNCNHEFEPASHHLRRGETLDGSPVPRHAIEGEFQKGAA